MILFITSMTWRLAGEAVPEDERIVVKEAAGDALLNASSSTHNLPLVAGGLTAGGTAPAVSDVERATWQQEKEKLYQLLDDKVSFVRNHYMYVLSAVKVLD